MTNNDDRDAGYHMGRRVGNTLYLDGVFIGSCITPEVAAVLVEAANRGRRETAASIGLARRPITATSLKLGDHFDSEGVTRTVASVRSTPDGGVDVGCADGTSVQFRADDQVTLR